MFPRDILNKIKWSGNRELEGVRISYVHRGAPNNRKHVDGRNIVRLEKSFFVMETPWKETSVPYHRIEEIFQDKEKVYDRDDYR